MPADGATDLCLTCGQPINYDGRGWYHPDAPYRHPAVPRPHNQELSHAESDEAIPERAAGPADRAAE